jgi:hypothetical protein
MKSQLETIDILAGHSINAPAESLRGLFRVHSGHEVPGSTFSERFFIFFNTGGVSDRDFEIGRALYF